MRALLTFASVCLCSGLAHAAPPSGEAESASRAQPPALAPKTETDPEEVRKAVDDAVSAFNNAQYRQVRDLLEPLLRDGATIADSLERARALRYLADATLLDEGMDVAAREARASEYIVELLDLDAEWLPPPGQHSDGLTKLTESVRKARAGEKAAACDAELVACHADYDNEKTLHGRLKLSHADLRRDYGKQEVLERTTRQNNRGLAFIPFGVGHFTQGRKGMGAGFLTAEVAFGGAGLGLLLWRTFGINCRRTAGFSPGSLECEGRENETVGVRARNAEQVMAWMTLGAFATDIIVAQILFQDTTETGVEKTQREDIRSEGKSLDELDDKARKEQRADEDAGKAGAKLKIRPSTVMTKKGAGMGLRLRF